MDFVNESKVEAGWTLGFEPDGRELLVVAVKATYSIPERGEDSRLLEEQVPLTEADEFTGEPGFSAPLYETDYAHRKPNCDVLLNGSAYAPGGRPVRRVSVGLSVGSMSKGFNVVGNRIWLTGTISIGPGRPAKFIAQPISYDCAFGGVDDFHVDETNHRTYIPNPIGRGYHANTSAPLVENTPMPNTEEVNRPVTMPSTHYRPMSFGPIGRNFGSRYPFAGTYDKEWLENKAPFWPENFDYRYFQAAPADQQIPYPKGGEEVILRNLTPTGFTRFCLPKVSMPVLFIPYRGKDKQVDAVIDTVLIEPDLKRFSLTWRVSLPLRRNCFEFRQTLVGVEKAGWRRANRTDGKKHYKSLSEFIESNKGQKEA